MSAPKLTPAREAMLAELAHDNPVLEEKWINFDPPYPRSVIAPLERMGLIETRGTGRHAEHRFTPKGRAALTEQEGGLMRVPLHGSKTHPLTAHGWKALRRIAEAPVPAQSLNPGVVDRLLREELAEIVQLPSPFMIHGGKAIQHLRATDLGRATLTRARTGEPEHGGGA